MAALIELRSLRLLGWTNLRRTSSLIGMIMLPILTSTCLISRATAPSRIAHGTILLIVSDSILFQKLVEIAKSVSITCVESISSELSHLSLGHELDLIHLGRSELHLSWVHSA